ncbi:MAG: DUF4433 domain-containing protein [Nannocystis sp.]|nr:DUF4433 domain-containing protein [Nannocystis sp.]MBA3548968.1 DUF4433 domain-containing protein [Nannocystis sp.]
MFTPPAQPKIYHITHVDNLSGIIKAGGLLSHAAISASGDPHATIGMGTIKSRRLSLPVACHPACHVGDFVPFYFCPRSVMLYVISKSNAPELTYRGGQRSIVHFESDLSKVVAWAQAAGVLWAFSLSNAGAKYAAFHSSLTHLNEINWPAVAERDFRDPAIKEGKQAEFLFHGIFPWSLVERIGVHSQAVFSACTAAVAHAPHKPHIELKSDWYY